MSFPEIKMPPLDEVKKHFTLFDYIDGERVAPTVNMGAFVHNPTYVVQFLIDSIADLGGSVSGYTRPAVEPAP